MSPRIRCPNCGFTITFANRRKTDLNAIVRAVQKKPRSFTELLKLTRLPRKTLAIRLKELMNMNLLTKNKLYYFNKDADPHLLESIQVPRFNRKKMLFALALIFVLIPTSIHVYAMLNSPPPPKPQIKGFLKVSLKIYNVKNLYAWQAIILYDSENMKIMNLTQGMLGTSYPFFVNATFPEDGVLLLASTLFGNVTGKSGNGTLATVTFALYSEHYKPPELLSNFKSFDTFLLDPDGVELPLNKVNLTLETELLT